MEAKDLEIVDNKDLAIQSETGMLLKMAVDKDLDVEKLEKLIDLKNREEERKCKQDFEHNFSLMKSEFPIIRKSATATDDNNKVMYKFAPLEDLQTECDPVITKHGFSYHWEESYISETQAKRVTFFLSGYGYTRSNFFDVPDIPGNKRTNPIQVAGIKSSYGKRYTYTAGLGLVISGEDTDADYLTFGDAIEYAEPIAVLKACNDSESLMEAWKDVYKHLKNDNDKIGLKVLTVVYNDMKKELTK